MGAQILLSREESAEGMGQKPNYAAKKDAQITHRKEDCALGMGHRSNYAAVKGAQVKQRKEDCVGPTEEEPNAVRLNAPTMLSLEEFVGDMGRNEN